MADVNSQIQELEKSMYETGLKLEKLRRDTKPIEVKNYSLKTSTGATTLLELFGPKDKLLVIHNMGQGCRCVKRCTRYSTKIRK